MDENSRTSVIAKIKYKGLMKEVAFKSKFVIKDMMISIGKLLGLKIGEFAVYNKNEELSNLQEEMDLSKCNRPYFEVLDIQRKPIKSTEFLNLIKFKSNKSNLKESKCNKYTLKARCCISITGYDSKIELIKEVDSLIFSLSATSNEIYYLFTSEDKVDPQLWIVFSNIKLRNLAYKQLIQIKNCKPSLHSAKIICYDNDLVINKYFIKEVYESIDPEEKTAHQNIYAKSINHQNKLVNISCQSTNLNSAQNFPINLKRSNYRSTLKNLMHSIDGSIVKVESNNPSKRKLEYLKKQQIALTRIGPSLNRISSPFISIQDKSIIEENVSRERWVVSKDFISPSACPKYPRLCPPISNYVVATPSNPPGLHVFRPSHKILWRTKKGFT